MTNNKSNNIMENIVDAQKQVVDTIVENTKKITNGNSALTDNIQKGTEWYKNFLEDQKTIFSKTTEKATTATDTAKENVSKMNEFYQNWFNTQMNTTKQMWEMSQNWMKNNTTTSANMDPMSQWNNMTNQWNAWTNNMNQSNNWMNQFNQMQSKMQNMNPFSQDTWKGASENFTNMFSQYNEILNNTFTNWQKNFESGTVQDAYRNMVNTAEGFSRFSEMMAPIFKSIQENTFTADMMKKFADPAQYKEMMDKYFGFMPEGSRQYIQNMTDMMSNAAKQMSQSGMGGFQQMRGMMNNMPGFNASEAFSNVMNGYNTFNDMMNNAFAPLTKMMTPNQYTKAISEWNDISKRVTVYNIKNAELQYMIYTQGSKVMDKLAENIAEKIKSGVEINSMMALYQEWLNISDKSFVSLFEGEEYSKLMAEVSSMQLTIRKDIEKQMEKSMSGLPVATRSEMDEIYKTIYDLKKQVRQLEKMLEIDSEVSAETEEKPAAKKAKKA